MEKTIVETIAELEQDALRYRRLCAFDEWPKDVEAAFDCGSKAAVDEAVDAWRARCAIKSDTFGGSRRGWPEA